MYMKDVPDTFPWHLWPHETTEDEPPAETQRRGVMRNNISPTLAEDSKEGVPSPSTNRPTRRPQTCDGAAPRQGACLGRTPWRLIRSFDSVAKVGGSGTECLGGTLLT